MKPMKQAFHWRRLNNVGWRHARVRIISWRLQQNPTFFAFFYEIVVTLTKGLRNNYISAYLNRG